LFATNLVGECVHLAVRAPVGVGEAPLVAPRRDVERAAVRTERRRLERRVAALRGHVEEQRARRRVVVAHDALCDGAEEQRRVAPVLRAHDGAVRLRAVPQVGRTKRLGRSFSE